MGLFDSAFDLAAKISLDTTEFDNGLDSSEKKMSGFGDKLRGAASGFGKIAGGVAAATAAATVAAAGAMVSFGKSSVQAGQTFDASMSQVAATMGTTVDEITDLRDFAMDMGAKTAFSASQAADALNYMALAGYDAETSMGMLPTVLNLAAAGGIELARASDMITDASSALGLSIEDTSVMVDQMAKASSKSNTSVEQLGEAMLTIGGTATLMSGGTDRLATTLGILADNGIKGSEAGTALRNMILKLSSPTTEGAKAMEELGLSIFDSEGNMRDMQDIMLDLNDALGSLTNEQRVQYISELFNARDIAAVNALLNTTEDRWNELGDAIVDSQGAAEAMANTQLDNLAGDITLFKSALEGAQIVVSDQLTPTIRDFVQFGTDGLTRLTDAFKAGGLEGAMSEFGNILSDSLEKLMDKLPSMMEAGSKLVESLISGVAKNAPKFVKAMVSAIKTMIKSVAKNIKTVASTLKDLVLTLVDAAIDILTDGDTITEVINAAVQLAIGIFTGLIQSIPKIVQAVPKIIESLVKGILRGAGQVGKAILSLFTGVDYDVARKEIENMAGNIVSFSDAVSNMSPKISDASELLSDHGRTISNLDELISEKEGNITQTLATALSEQRDLRDDELENIRGYLDELRALQEEKLGIYRQNQISELKKVQFETGNITQETAAQFVSNSQEAYDQAQSATEEWYTNELTRIENFYKARNEIGSEAYVSEQQSAHDSYVKMSQENKSYYDDTIALVQQESKRWVGESASAFGDLHNNLQTLNNKNASVIEQLVTTVADWVGALGPVEEAYAGMLKTVDLQGAASFLELTAQLKQNGQAIDDESKTAVNNILSSFEDLPAGTEEAGKSALLGMVKGLTDEIPELENASEMTADEIVDTIRDKLDIHSPSRVMQDVGENVVQGLWSGINNSSGWLASNLSAWTQRIVDSLKSNLVNQMNLATIGVGYSVNSSPSSVNYNHTGTIHVDGVNNRGEFVGAADLVYNDLVNRLAMEVRT